MPTRIYRRIWCKTCQDFTLHTSDGNDGSKCRECDTVYTDVYLKDIPKDKLEAQRKRYTESQGNVVDKYLGLFTETPEQRRIKEIAHMFSEPGSDVEIIESDAGQKKIDDRKRKERAKRMAELREEREKGVEEYKKYKGLGRNDICICGSGKKYKKCCLQKIQGMENKYRYSLG